MCSSPHRILMFAPGFAPYSFSENIANSKLALALRNQGWNVDTISRVDEGPLYGTNDWHEPWTRLRDTTHIIRYPRGSEPARAVDVIRQSARMRFPVAGIRWAGRAFDLALKLHRTNNYNFVLSRSPNDIGHVPALAFSRITKVPWIANWNDPPSHLWPEPYENSKGLFHKLLSRQLTARVLEETSACTFPAERLRRRIMGSIGTGPEHFSEVIPHIALSGYVSSARKPDGCFRISHAGNLSRERKPEIFLEGMARFLGRVRMDSSFECRFLGVQDSELRSIVESKGLENYVKTLKGLPYLEALTELEQSDVLAVIEAPCKEGIFLPSKVSDYAQVGRPLLAVSPEEGTMADLIHETRAGEFAACTQPEAVANALSALYASWRRGTLERDYAVETLMHLFHPEKIIRQYERLFSFTGQ